MKQINPCSRCGERVGWYQRKVLRYRQHFTPDGYPDHAEDTGGETSGVLWCLNCNAKITKEIEEPQQEARG